MSPAIVSRDAGQSEARHSSLREAFDSWAQVYDEQVNPLLHLEQRFLAGRLPSVRSLDVLDAGCGTGRWLQIIAEQFPRSLTGVDSSAEMLVQAAGKVGDRAALLEGECSSLPVVSHSMDLVLASFVASYLPDLEIFARECERVCRAGGNLFLTDMHPATAQICNWKRSFKIGSASVDIEAQSYSLSRIASIFKSYGFELCELIEPTFGLSEAEMLNLNGKADTNAVSAGLPAIYLLHLKKLLPTKTGSAASGKQLRLSGARLAFGADESIFASIDILDARIGTIISHSSMACHDADSAVGIDLRGYLVLPGLINSHDHLEFGLYPNLGYGPYSNAAEWADDIHRVDSQVIERHRAVPKDIRLWWGGIRNLLCGVTTVCHHNPLSSELLETDFPVRVVSKFGWAHSLALGPDIAERLQATLPSLPFILHAAEGVDAQSGDEVSTLYGMGALDERTVLVHCLALTVEGAHLLNERGTAVILCPSSNQFLFDEVPAGDVIAVLRDVALGSDSPLTATGDLLDEIRFARTSVGLTAEDLYPMVTEQAARILHLDAGEGGLKPGGIADLVAVKDKGATPASVLGEMHYSDVELVMLGGRVQLASPEMLLRLPNDLRRGLEAISVNGHVRWLRAPISKLCSEAMKVLGPDLWLSGREVRYDASP